jgi:hypothetical protein
MVDLRRDPTGTERSNLEIELSGLDGIRRARVSARVCRLVLVDYDPKTINSQKILGAVAHRGFDARLIGM